MSEAIMQCIGVSAFVLGAFLLGFIAGTKHARTFKHSRTIHLGWTGSGAIIWNTKDTAPPDARYVSVVLED
jgi:hypothetical protein